LRILKEIKIEFATEVSIIFRKNMKKASSGMFTLFVGQEYGLLHIYNILPCFAQIQKYITRAICGTITHRAIPQWCPGKN
jgi:hypothetical protein